MRGLAIAFLSLCCLEASLGQESQSPLKPFVMNPGTPVNQFQHYETIRSNQSLAPSLLYYRLNEHDNRAAIASTLDFIATSGKYKWITSEQQRFDVASAVYQDIQAYREQFYSGKKPTNEEMERLKSNVLEILGDLPGVPMGPVEVEIGTMIKDLYLVYDSYEAVEADRNRVRLQGEAMHDSATHLMNMKPMSINDMYKYVAMMRNNPQDASAALKFLASEGVFSAADLAQTDAELLQANPDFKNSGNADLLVDLKGQQEELRRLVGNLNASTGAAREAIQAQIEGLRSSFKTSLEEYFAAQAAAERSAQEKQIFLSSSAAFLGGLARLTGDREIAKYANAAEQLSSAYASFDKAQQLGGATGLAAAAASMNYATAALTVANLFFSFNDSGAPSVEEAIYEAVAQMRKEMHQRFDIIEGRLDTLQATTDRSLAMMLGNFERLFHEIEKVHQGARRNERLLLALHDSLSALRYELHVTSRNLEQMLEEGFHRDFEESLNEFIFRYEDFAASMDAAEFQRALMKFKTYATEHADDAIELGPSRYSPAEMSNVGVTYWLGQGDIFKQADNLLHALWARDDIRFDFTYPPAGRVKNLNSWYMASLAAVELIRKNPAHAQTLQPNYLEELAAAGSDTYLTLQAAFQPATLDDLITNYTKSHARAEQQFASIIRGVQATAMAGLPIDKKPIGPYDTLYITQDINVEVIGTPTRFELPPLPNTPAGSAFLKQEHQNAVSRPFPMPRIAQSIIPNSVETYRRLTESYFGKLPQVTWTCSAAWEDMEINSASEELFLSIDLEVWNVKARPVIRLEAWIDGPYLIVDSEQAESIGNEPRRLATYVYRHAEKLLMFEAKRIETEPPSIDFRDIDKYFLAPNWHTIANAIDGIWTIDPDDIIFEFEPLQTPNLQGAGLTQDQIDGVQAALAEAGNPQAAVEEDTIEGGWQKEFRFDADGQDDFIQKGIELLWSRQQGLFFTDLVAIAWSGPEQAIGDLNVVEETSGRFFIDSLRSMRGAKLLLSRYLELVTASQPTRERQDTLAGDDVAFLRALFDDEVLARYADPGALYVQLSDQLVKDKHKTIEADLRAALATFLQNGDSLMQVSYYAGLDHIDKMLVMLQETKESLHPRVSKPAPGTVISAPWVEAAPCPPARAPSKKGRRVLRKGLFR